MGDFTGRLKTILVKQDASLNARVAETTKSGTVPSLGFAFLQTVVLNLVTPANAVLKQAGLPKQF